MGKGNVGVTGAYEGLFYIVPFPVSWTVKMKKKQKETQDILLCPSRFRGQ